MVSFYPQAHCQPRELVFLMLFPHISTYWFLLFSNHHPFTLVAQSCPTLCDPMNHSTPGFPVHHQLPEFTQTHVHWVNDAIQPSHPLSSPSPPAPNLSQYQGIGCFFTDPFPGFLFSKYYSLSSKSPPHSPDIYCIFSLLLFFINRWHNIHFLSPLFTFCFLQLKYKIPEGGILVWYVDSCVYTI